MDVAVGVGRTVVQHKARPALGVGAQPLVKPKLPPALENAGLLLRQAGAHRKFGFGQKQRFAVIARF